MKCPNCGAETYQVTYSKKGNHCPECEPEIKPTFNTITITGRRGKAWRNFAQ